MCSFLSWFLQSELTSHNETWCCFGSVESGPAGGAVDRKHNSITSVAAKGFPKSVKSPWVSNNKATPFCLARSVRIANTFNMFN